MQIKRIFLGIALAITLNSCINTIDGNGDVQKEKRKVSSFSEIHISGAFNIILKQSNEAKIEVEADENLLELIETEVKGNTLYISSLKPIGNAKSLKLHISAIDIHKIHASGAIQLSNKGIFNTVDLNIKASGATDLDLNITAKNLNLKMSGSSEVTLTGSAIDFGIKISGAGDLDAIKMKTKRTTITISGAGSATVFAKEKLKVKVSGAGSVKYKGSPVIEKRISGAGSINKI